MGPPQRRGLEVRGATTGFRLAFTGWGFGEAVGGLEQAALSA